MQLVCLITLCVQLSCHLSASLLSSNFDALLFPLVPSGFNQQPPQQPLTVACLLLNVHSTNFFGTKNSRYFFLARLPTSIRSRASLVSGFNAEATNKEKSAHLEKCNLFSSPNSFHSTKFLIENHRFLDCCRYPRLLHTVGIWTNK